MNPAFPDMLRPLLGNETDELLQALQTEPVVSVRLSGKAFPIHNAESIIHNDHAGNAQPNYELSILNYELNNVPWCDNAFYLQDRPQFTLDPLMHAGCYYVQDASSMFIQQVLSHYVSRDSVILDLCAAPGGKSTLIAEYLNEHGLLVANEVNRQRVFILSENLQKWGKSNMVVTHNKAKDFGEKLAGVFDCVLIDAPCSGEGMMRKDETARTQWSEKLVNDCAALQRQIITDAWDALKEGGILIYSTCTFNPIEDDENARWIAEHFGAEILSVPTQPEWAITETIGYHFFPHKVRGEGFYLCAFRKTQGEAASRRLNTNRKSSSKHPFDSIMRSWLRNPDYYTFTQDDRFINAYPVEHQALIEYLAQHFLCITLGLGLAEIRGNAHNQQVVGQHQLALSRDLQKRAFPCMELSLEESLNYLRCEAITPRYDTPAGMILVTYQDHGLGFVKNVGNRCNNMYPKEWRIRKL